MVATTHIEEKAQVLCQVTEQGLTLGPEVDMMLDPGTFDLPEGGLP